MSGSAIGSNIARGLRLNERQRVILLGCGAAAAIAAIFNAPIAGMVFAMEVILGEWSRISLAPIAIASVAGAEVSHLLRGNQIPFGPAVFAIDTFDIVAAVGLAVCTAIASILLTRLLRTSHRLWDAVPTPAWVRALLGGFVVGGLGLAMPIVLGEGYAAVRRAISGELGLGVVILVAAIIAKMVATSMTIGSGGSGGIFAPSLLVGSLVGLGYYHLLGLAFPGHEWVGEGCFALLGMAGLVSGILQAPLTGIFLIFEITGGWSVILPLIVVSVVSSTVCQRVEPASFYLRDLVRSGHLLRPGTDARVLADIRVRELIELDCLTVSEADRLREFIPVVRASQRNWFPVVDDDSRLLGMLHLDDLRPYLFSPEMYDAVVLGEVMDPDPVTVSPDDTLEHVLDIMDSLPAFSLPVREDGRFVGMISKATLLDQYRKELNVQTDV
jgi:CIC family chloride channel protein